MNKIHRIVVFSPEDNIIIYRETTEKLYKHVKTHSKNRLENMLYNLYSHNIIRQQITLPDVYMFTWVV
jgi:isocitrate dehydrogenase